MENKNEEKIKEIAQNTREKIKDFSLYKNPDTGNNALDLTGMREIIEDALKEYGDYIRQQTLEEVKGCVPEERHVEEPTHQIPDDPTVAADQAYNFCRQQTLENIENLAQNNR